jgi:hypothetical protein
VKKRTVALLTQSLSILACYLLLASRAILTPSGELVPASKPQEQQAQSKEQYCAGFRNFRGYKARVGVRLEQDIGSAETVDSANVRDDD